MLVLYSQTGRWAGKAYKYEVTKCSGYVLCDQDRQFARYRLNNVSWRDSKFAYFTVISIPLVSSLYLHFYLGILTYNAS